MSTELYIPNIVGKPGTEFYEHSETFRRRSAASKAKMLKYWSDGRHHRRVDKQAKAVDVYDLDGNFIKTFPSSLKAAIGLGLNRTRPTTSEDAAVAKSRNTWAIGSRTTAQGATSSDRWPRPRRPRNAATARTTAISTSRARSTSPTATSSASTA